MIFGFGKKKPQHEEEEFDEEMELVLFQGALNGKDAQLSKNPRLAEAALIPAKELVSDGLARRAEMIRVEPRGERATVTLNIDGIGYPGGRLSKQMATAVTQILKMLSGLDAQQRRKPQSGGINAEFDEQKYTLYVETKPLPTGGERLTIYCHNHALKLDTPEDLGFSDDFKSQIREMTSQKQGILFVCGTPHSGTTTTMFGVLRSIDVYLYSIFNIADIGDRELVNITNFEVDPEDSLEETLNRVARVEADVVFMDPLKDAETAQTIFKMQKKLTILSELAAKEPAQGILQLIKWVGDPRLVAEGLHAIIGQKLIRLLCSECKEAYRPNPKLITKVGLPAETKVLYRQFKPRLDDQSGRRGDDFEPCDQCGGLGYYGRVAMFEMIEMTESMKKLIMKKPSSSDIKALARKEKMQTLQRDGLRLVAEGKTSLEELQRIFKAQ